MDKPRRIYTLDEVTLNDVRMLSHAASLTDKSWYCYGTAWYKLDQLELIDDDLKPTPLGMAVADHVNKGNT